MRIVTFDFHNTLFTCDRWFDLEVRTLPWQVALDLGLPGTGSPTRAAVLAAYRQLRSNVVRTGYEIDSYTSVDRIFTSVGISAERDAVRSSIDRLMSDAVESASLVPGAGDLVRDLHERGIRLAVISSAIHHEFLRAALERVSIAGCFEKIVTSASSGFYKSNPEIYRSAITALGGNPHSCVHVGDSLRWDVGSAQRAGIRTVWLDHDGEARPWDDSPLPVPDFRLESLAGASGAILDLLAAGNTGRE